MRGPRNERRGLKVFGFIRPFVFLFGTAALHVRVSTVEQTAQTQLPNIERATCDDPQRPAA